MRAADVVQVVIIACLLIILLTMLLGCEWNRKDTLENARMTVDLDCEQSRMKVDLDLEQTNNTEGIKVEK